MSEETRMDRVERGLEFLAQQLAQLTVGVNTLTIDVDKLTGSSASLHADVALVVSSVNELTMDIKNHEGRLRKLEDQ